MENRGFRFLFTVIILFGGMMLLQPFLFPKKPAPDPDNVVQADDEKAKTDDDAKKKDQADPATDQKKKETVKDKQDESKTDKSSQPKTEQDKDKTKTELKAPDQDPKGDDKKSDSKTKAKDDKQQSKVDQPKVDQPKPAPAGFVKDQLIPLGSMDPDSECRMLVCINRLGGTIRRISLNSRRPDGRLRYRNIAPKAGYPFNPGYLGNLELTETKSGGGCQVNFVGPGTPAAALIDGVQAIQVGDVIEQVAETTINSPADFDEVMAFTKPGMTIDVLIRRGSQTAKVPIDLMNKPLDTIRPEPLLEYLDKENQVPMPRSEESLVLTLLQPEGREWTEFDPELRTGLWDVVPGGDENSVTLSKTIDLANSKVPDLTGQITVLKKFTVSQGESEYRAKQMDRHYHVHFEFEILYKGDGRPKVAFELRGPTGTPIDGWWYQHKIHGESLALFKAAGSRDVVGQSKGGGFNFIGGPKVVSNKISDSPKNIAVFDPNKEQQGMMNYLAVDCQYFAAALIPDERYETDDGSRVFDCYSAFVWVCQPEISENKKERRTTDLSFRMFSNTIELENDKPYSAGFELFTGPKEHHLLKQYGLNDLRSFGWFAIISRPLTGLLRFFFDMFSMIGLPSYGLAIILLTVLVRSAMIPISRKAALNAQMMQKLAPQMKDIAEKYKEDMEGRLKAQRELFSSHKYNPYGGCLLMFLQLPIFIGLYRGLSVDMALQDQPLIPGLQWCADLAGPDRLFYWENWAFMPTWIGGETGWLGPYFNILPLVTVVLFLIQQKMFTPPPTDDQQKMMHKMMTFMMLFMGVLFFKVSSGLCLYFITSSLWGIIERKMLPKPKLKFDESDGKSTVDKKSAPKNKQPAEVLLREKDEDRKKRERDRRAREKRKRDKERQ